MRYQFAIMRFMLTALLTILINPVLEAQHYYKDIVSIRQLKEEMAQLKATKIKNISVESFEADGTASKGFFCKKEISRDFKKTELGMRSLETTPSLTITLYDDDGNIQSTYDSSDISVKKIEYRYDRSGRIQSVSSIIRSSDDDFITEISEEHRYFYTSTGSPEKMTIIKNRKDSSTILFANDEQGHTAVEKEISTGRKIYYYYNEGGKLSDIVRENERTGKMLPDYMFEYDDKGRLLKMLNTEEGSSEYLVWLYFYNEDGLKGTEKIFSKDRKLLGRLEYSYKKR